MGTLAAWQRAGRTTDEAGVYWEWLESEVVQGREVMK